MDPRVKKMLQALVSLVIVALIFWYVQRQFADLSSVWVAFKTLTWREIGVLAAVTVWNLVTYWFVIVLATPGLTYPQAAVMTQATTAVSNSTPAGGAIGVGLTYTMLSSWGFSKSRGTLSVVVTGIWNNFVKLGTPILALAIVALQGQPSGGRVVAAALGIAGLGGAIALFSLILRSETFAARTGVVLARWTSRLRALVRRGPVTGWDLAITKFRSRVLELVQDRWARLSVATIVSHASLYAVLVISLRVMGVSDAEVGWAQILTVFAFARLVTAIPLTPGGLGVVELALIAGIIRAGGDEAPVVAAVLLYRLLTYVLPILLGGLTYVYWRRNSSWRNSAPPMTLSAAAANKA
ncbi:MAG: lysylphosphatidylglycerol synthase transmembrane domain-containing protein [Actinomycetota bacterium]